MLSNFNLTLATILIFGMTSFADICKEKRKVVIATEGTKFEPFRTTTPKNLKLGSLNIETNVLAGFEIDLLDALFRQPELNCYKPQLIQNYNTVGEVTFTDPKTNTLLKKSNGPIDFAALFPSLSLKVNQEKYAWDITIATTGITQARRDLYNIDFSDSYYTPRKHFFGKNQIVDFPNGLSGKKVGVKSGTLFDKYSQFINQQIVGSGKPAFEIVSFDDVGAPAFDKIFIALKSDQIDYSLADDELLLMNQIKDKELMVIHLQGPDLFSKNTLGHEVLGEGVGVAFRKSDIKLREDFNSALKKLLADCSVNGYKAIYERYFKSESSISGCGK